MNARTPILRWLAPLLPLLATLPARGAEEPALEDLPPLAPWVWSGSLRAAGGYKDNVELSSFAPVRSSFLRTEAEFLGWRLPEGRGEVQIFGAALLTRYLEKSADQDERQVFGRAEVKWNAGTGWVLGGSLEGFHLDQFLDLSATEAERVSAKLQSTGGIASLAVRREGQRRWIELKPALKRDTYRDHLEDSWQPGARLAAGWQWENQAEATLAVSAARHDFDDRRQYSGRGLPIPGTQLAFQQQEAELKIAWRAGANRAWRLTSTLLAQRNRDNGPGYYDYGYAAWKQEIEWRGALWRCRLLGRLGRYDYVRRPVSTALNAPVWRKDESSAELRLERRLGKRWIIYGEYIAERSRATNTLASYRVGTGQLGLEWTH